MKRFFLGGRYFFPACSLRTARNMASWIFISVVQVALSMKGLGAPGFTLANFSSI